MIYRRSRGCRLRRRPKPHGPGRGAREGQKPIKNNKKIESILDAILAPFWAPFGSLLGHFWDRISDRFSRFVFYHIYHDLEVHFGSMFVLKTAPGHTPTRKGRPSILNNSPIQIKLFDPVVMAGGSRGRHLKPNTFMKKFWDQNVSKMTPKMVSETAQNSIKK